MDLTVLWVVLAAVAVVATAPGTVELLLLTLCAVLPARREPAAVGPSLRLAVVVPAHDEARVIGRCVDGLRRADAGGHRVSVVVVADNCRDATAACARAAGAIVLERHEPDAPGKGRALAFAFRHVCAQGFDGVLVVDADARVDADVIPACARFLAAGADGVLCRNRVDNRERSVWTRLWNISQLAMTVVRPRGRDRLGLSSGPLGTGFALRRETLEAVPFQAFSVMEDLEYHLDLVLAGRRVRFCDSTSVWSAMPVTLAAARGQRARWEGGRLRLAIEKSPALLHGIARGRVRLVEPLLDLLLLPLAFHGLLLLAALAIPLGWSRLYALIGLGTVALHLAAAAWLGNASWRDLGALLAAPWYLVWKLSLVKAIVAGSRVSAPWVRAPREDTGGVGPATGRDPG
jgi:cellulose synthase/poly-beta-1,6-N-acetylglucosamine synthase-like glycosyltransferase